MILGCAIEPIERWLSLIVMSNYPRLGIIVVIEHFFASPVGDGRKSCVTTGLYL
jgi:hypothetical protein